MYIFKRPFLIGLFGVSLALLMDSAPASSLAPSGWEQLAGCAERVRELEAEVEALRAELRGEKAQAAPGAGYREEHVAALWSLADCSVPFEISRTGVKRYKERCSHVLPSLAPCDLPFELDSRGVKTFKRGCVAGR